MIEQKQITTTSFTLSEEGSGIVANGSHEYRVWEVLPAKGGQPMAIPDLQVSSIDVAHTETSKAETVGRNW